MIGEHDLPDFHAIADLLARTIPNARKVELARAGHMANMEAAESLNQTVLDFLAEA